MLQFNILPADLQYSDDKYLQYEINEQLTTRHNFPQLYRENTITLDNINAQNIYQDNNIQNTRIHDWINGCQILGFIPDSSTLNNSNLVCSAAPSCCDCCLDYQNKHVFTRQSQWYSTEPAKNTMTSNLKRKRKRTIFTTEQIIALEGVFKRKPYINREERKTMMKKLHVNEKAIKVWFQNRRRLTDKKYQERESDSSSSRDTPDLFSDRLTLIEIQIKENTDENGYVTLSENVMSELVSIIDYYLSKDVTESWINSTTEGIMMYEPISPASSEDFNEKETLFKTRELLL